MRRLLAHLWLFEFAIRLSRAFGRTVRVKDLVRTMRYLPKASMPGQGAAHRFNFTLARALHAAVVHLEQDRGMAPHAAVKTAREAFVPTGAWLGGLVVRLWLWLDRDPFAGIAARGPSQLAHRLWGDGMQMQDHYVSGEISLTITACPFRDYFWNAGRSDLAPILCAWDQTWIDVTNRSGRPLRVVLLGTLAKGDAACDFVFRDLAGGSVPRPDFKPSQPAQ